MSPLDFGADAVEQAELVRSKQIKPSELVAESIRRAEVANGELNAIIHPRFEAAMREAAEMDNRVATGDIPAFAGVPFTLKDLWPSMAGEPFHQGVKALRDSNHRADRDANLVQRYREAGFIVIGRTNTPELGLAATTEPEAYGPTRNPWSTEHGPGGSSGGASSSVAAGITTIANASDGGGSIRIPAAHCNLVGLKTSRGRVSMGPWQEEWNTSVQHVVCHSVRDTAAALDATAIPFLTDGVVAPRHVERFVDALAAPTPMRIGFTTTCRDGISTHTDNATATEQAATKLAEFGHEVSEASPAILHDPMSSSAMGTISTASTAVRLNAIAEIVGRPLTADDVEVGTWELYQRASAITGTQVIAAQAKQHAHRRNMLAWWEEFDLLVTPTTAAPPPLLGTVVPTAENPFNAQIASIPFAAFTSPFNSTGQPAISVPAGFTSGGLPLGVQIVAAYGREDLLIAVAAQLEQAWNWADTRSPMHP